MKILNNLNNVSFQKKLMAKCSVIKYDEPIDCRIYSLEADKKQDRNYFKNLEEDRIWQDNYFVSSLNVAINNKFTSPNDYYKSVDIFVLEDRDESCLGYCEIDRVQKRRMSLNYLETAPEYVNDRKNKKSNIRYIGESIISFLVLLAKKEDKNLTVWTPSDSARPFYQKKIGFNSPRVNYVLSLDRNLYDTVVNKNKAHTTTGVVLLSRGE